MDVTLALYVALGLAAIVSDVLTGPSNMTIALGLGATLLLILWAVSRSPGE